jgi:heme-degrading monooxygenase HmoA
LETSDSVEENELILEHALLNVISGRETEFESAFREARKIIESMPGFISLRVARSLEVPGEYLLLVEWNTLEDHTIGFRQSAEYQQWRNLLHHFYEPFPVVEHFIDLK